MIKVFNLIYGPGFFWRYLDEAIKVDGVFSKRNRKSYCFMIYCPCILEKMTLGSVHMKSPNLKKNPRMTVSEFVQISVNDSSTCVMERSKIFYKNIDRFSRYGHVSEGCCVRFSRPKKVKMILGHFWKFISFKLMYIGSWNLACL